MNEPAVLALVDALATRMRRVIESVAPADLPFAIRQFPRGACGDASLMLAEYLRDNGVDGLTYVSGCRGGETGVWWHAWLRCGEVIADITADQFDDAPAAVIVAKGSPWHDSFGSVTEGPADWRAWSGSPFHELMRFYAELRPMLF